MSSTTEIRWHGRGGQGAKTASLLLADVAFNTGRYVQGFPEYGPERMGAPITAYNRLSDERITIHSNINKPDMVVIVDETLIGPVDVLSGLKDPGTVVVNSSEDEAAVRKALGNYKGRLVLVDAQKICEATMGKYFPNIPMLAAVMKACSLMSDDQFIGFMKESLAHKFAGKPQAVESNLKAIEKTLEEVVV